MGKKFILMTHDSLINYFRKPSLNARKSRWVDFLSEFDFEIKHLKGKENQVADALSRKIHCIHEFSFHESRSLWVVLYTPLLLSLCSRKLS